jgi:acyl carrier protein
MSRLEFLKSMDVILDLPEGTLTGAEQIDSLEQWNSMAVIAFIALADENNRAKLSPRQLASCDTVSDLLALAGV